MKVCPKCEQSFNDDDLSYCLLDGTPLVLTESQPTVVIPRPGPAPKKSRTALWVGLVVVVMLVGIIFVAAVLTYFYGIRGDNMPNSVNSSPSPKSSATPKSTPSQTPTSSPAGQVSPTAQASPPGGANDEANEITPITWSTAAIGFKDEVGQTYKFQCPEDGTPGAVWGSDIYTADSSICTAAADARIIT